MALKTHETARDILAYADSLKKELKKCKN